MKASRTQHYRVVERNRSPCLQSPEQPATCKAREIYDGGEDIDNEHSKQRRIRGILNKLTPQNFDKLFEQIKEIQIGTSATLTGVIGQVYDKALVEPTFCEMYASLCVQLAVELPEIKENGDIITFKRLLLDKCQEAFENGEREQKEAAKAEQNGVVKNLEEEREQKKASARRRMLGNIRFIGELFKKSMLTERIMHECIKNLLGDHDCIVEENIEALCSLLTVIGQLIDNAKARSQVDTYFNFIHELSSNQELSTRLKFLLKGLIELRRNGWQSRQKLEGPKTITELHKAAAKDQRLRSARDGKPSRRKSKGSSDSSIQGPVPSVSLQESVGVSMLAPEELMLKQTRSMQDARMDPEFLYRCKSLSLSGKGSMDSKLEEFHRETVAYSKTTNPEHRVTANATGIRLATGLHTGLGEKAVSSYSITTQAGMNHVKSTSFEKRNSYWLPTQAEWPVVERPLAHGMNLSTQNRGQGAQSLAGAGHFIQPVIPTERPVLEIYTDEKNSYWLYPPAERPVLEFPLACGTNPSTQDRGQVARSLADAGHFIRPVTPVTFLSERPSVLGSDACANEQLEQNFNEIIGKYFRKRDVNETAEYVGKSKASRFQSCMVSCWVLKLLEEEEDSKSELLAKLLVHLCWMEQPVLANEHLIQGCILVFSLLENSTVNVPKALYTIARLLGRLVSYGILSLDDIGKVLRVRGSEKPLEIGEPLKMLIIILDTLRREKGETVMNELFKASKLDIEDFFVKDKKMLIALLKEKELLPLCPMLEVDNYIDEALLEDEPISDILLWLQRNVPEFMSNDPHFLWTLMIHVLKHAVPSLATHNYKEVQEKFRKYGPLLRRFSYGRTGTAKNHQQHYITAVHDFVNQAGYPSIVENILYEYLYTAEVISEHVYVNTHKVSKSLSFQNHRNT